MKEVIEAPFSRVSRKIVARSGEEYLLLTADEVYAFAAERDLVWIITARKRYLATQPLKVIQENLKTRRSAGSHRSALGKY